ncbi:MAG: Phospholipase/Carboxylesterase, partial [Chthonomonadales bacterium]|nr:Phospholipase/Carboxylesterase [Chthonomonadales bacterium]
MSALLRNLLLCVCLLALSPGVRAQDIYPTTKAAWIERIARIRSAIGEDYGAMYHLEQQDDELVYQVLKEGWPRFTGDGVKSYLLAIVVDGKATPPPDRTGKPNPQPPPNPHLLEILNLGMTDTKGEPLYAARLHLYGLAFADFYEKPKEYESWYNSASKKPLETVIRDGMKDYMARLDQADEPTRKRMLEIAGEVPFKSGTSTVMDINGKMVTTIQTTGLTGIRRKIALETGLLEKWVQYVGRENIIDVAAPAAINVLNFMPDTAFLDLHEDALRDILIRISQRSKTNYYAASGQYLAAFQKTWAVDLLIRRLVSDFQTDGFGYLLNNLEHVTDPRIIPTLIALLDTGEMESWHEQQTVGALRRLGGPSAKNNLALWHDWWKEHKSELPEEVRDMPFPRLQSAAEQANVVMVRKQTVQLHLAGDAMRSYLLLTPGILLPRAPQPTTAAEGDNRPFVAVQDRPGLIVVLSDSDPNNRAIQEFWQQAVNKAFSNKYLVAIVMAPRWGQEKPYSWVTSINRSRTPTAKFTVETFVGEIVADIVSRYPIHPDHIFLHGEGGGGLAAYACSLQPQTPFKGFSLLGAEFRSAQLPPVEAAKGRRYYIQAYKADKAVPYFLTTAAQSMLTKAGATVQLPPLS